MCGFAGFLGFGDLNTASIPLTAQRMGNAIQHRGPDDSGVWHDENAQIALVHQRLSILDLSAAGHQPMASPSGRYVIAFNGEVYNHLELRQSLEKDSLKVGNWRGHSDTETLLAGIDAWGLESTLTRAVGMFALAVWDREVRVLSLARDRMGEKPLYFGWQGQGQRRVFLFGSELSALKAHPLFDAPIDRNALALMMRHNYIPAPYSIHESISKLEPGTLLQISLAEQKPKIHSYWSLASVIQAARPTPFNGTAEQAVDKLETIISDAIRHQMTADVPLGAFLSGGIDSSTVVAIMQAQSSRPIKTFTIGFYEKDYNEAEHAKAVAKHLGTDHTEMYVTPEQALAVIPKIPSLYSEPFSDSSQIPTFLVSELARQHVTVSLSGDAGDELFCGYSRYPLAQSLWEKISCIPAPMRHVAAGIITRVPPTVWNKAGSLFTAHRIGDKLYKGAQLLDNNTLTELYRGMISHCNVPDEIVLGALEPVTAITAKTSSLTGLNLNASEQMMALDMLSYLPDDILVKVDRAAMGVGLETRVPLLDHRVVEFAWSLPHNYKFRNAKSKWPLRQILYRHVPPHLIERRKMGFSIPLDQWLRGPLRDWAESLLSESRLYSEGFFHPKFIRQKWTEHQSGERNWQNLLWNVLMFQAWLEHQ